MLGRDGWSRRQSKGGRGVSSPLGGSRGRPAAHLGFATADGRRREQRLMLLQPPHRYAPRRHCHAAGIERAELVHVPPPTSAPGAAAPPTRHSPPRRAAPQPATTHLRLAVWRRRRAPPAAPTPRRAALGLAAPPPRREEGRWRGARRKGGEQALLRRLIVNSSKRRSIRRPKLWPPRIVSPPCHGLARRRREAPPARGRGEMCGRGARRLPCSHGRHVLARRRRHGRRRCPATPPRAGQASGAEGGWESGGAEGGWDREGGRKATELKI